MSLGFAGWIARALSAVRTLAPYAAIEILLPGGSLIALVLWLYQQRKNAQPNPQAYAFLRYGTCTVESCADSRGKSTLT